MASDIPEFTGWQKYFNSYTPLGRASAARITYGVVGLTFLFFKLKPSKKEKN